MYKENIAFNIETTFDIDNDIKHTFDVDFSAEVFVLRSLDPKKVLNDVCLSI